MVNLADRINRQEQLLDQVRTRVAMQIGRGVLAALDATAPGRATITGYQDSDVLDGREFVSDYGVSTRPHPGCEALIAFLGGLRSNGVVLRLFDRRYSITLDYGEVALHDDLGQKVHLTRSGIVIDTPLDILMQAAGNVTIKAGQKLRLEAEDIERHGSQSDSFDVDGWGERLSSLGGGTYQTHTWQQGAVFEAQIVDPINSPEGPPS